MAGGNVQDNDALMGTSFDVSPDGDPEDSPDASPSQDYDNDDIQDARPNAAPQRFVPTGPITLDPSTIPSSTLNPRSCVTCRRRKVRCDKYMPCGNCRKARIQCVFPAPGRAPRRPRLKDPNAPPKQTSDREIELMKRLRKLEGIVEDLSGQIEFEASRQPASGGEATPETVVEYTQDRDRRRQQKTTPWTENLASSGNIRTQSSDVYPDLKRSAAAEVQEFGRLVLNEKGRTQYVSNSFWSKVNDEINELRAETQRLTDDDSHYSEDENVVDVVNPYANPNDHHSFVFGYSSSDIDLHGLHPLPSQIFFIWQVFIENVDPLVKILHVPTMNITIRELRNNMKDLTAGMEALLFAIYYGAITSMEDEEVKTNFGASKVHLINRYRFATEQALARASFLTTSEVVVLQALALFTVLVRRYDDTRLAWTLTGLAIRIAQSLGIHREGTHFDSLTPFDIEMRRRLWWAICILDLRAAEDQGTEVTIAERTFDTQYPLNINDVDLTPGMKEFPEPRQGATDMTFCLIRYEICTLGRKMHSATNSMGPCPRDANTTLQEREDMLLEMYEHIDKKYLKRCDDKDGDILNWVAATVARLIMAKMSLIMYQPMLMPSAGKELSQEIRDRLFMSSLEVVEYNKVLNSEPKCRSWRWLFQTYTQWHAVAYLLLEVCRRPWSASVERGWMALTSTFQRADPVEFARPAVWIPLRKLMLKGKRHREEEIARLRADPAAAQRLDVEESNKVTPASFQHLPSSVRNTLALERWRKLVGTKGPERPIHVSCDPATPTPQAVASKDATPKIPEAQDAVTGQYLDHMMSEHFFNPTAFLSVAYTQKDVDALALARQVFPNKPSNAPSGVNTTLCADGLSATEEPIENFSSRGPIAFPNSELVSAKDLQHLTGTETVMDDNPPPWLWNNPWGGSGTRINALDTDGGTSNFNALDEQDISMDAEEEVSWGNWMDSGLAMGRAGFAGGI